MKVLPIRPAIVRLTELSIAPKVAPTIDDFNTVKDRTEWSGLEVNVTLQHSAIETEGAHRFGVALTLSIGDGDRNKDFPYVIKAAAAGSFDVARSIKDPVLREDFAFTAGASYLYGMIREEVSALTARHWYGQVNFPLMDFADEAPSRRTGDSSSSK